MRKFTRCTSAFSPGGGPSSNAMAAPLGYSWSRPVLRFSGELDVATAATVRAAVELACLEASGEVLIDLAAVQFFDAITLGIFAHANARLNQTGSWLTLRGLNPHQEKVLRICGLENLSGGSVCRTWGRSSAATHGRTAR